MEQTFIPPKVKAKKNYMEHEYLLERKSFWMMRKFYVSQFNIFSTPMKFRKKIRFMERHQLDLVMNEFSHIQFGGG